MLFVDWVLGKAGQQTLVKFAFPSVRRDLHKGSTLSTIVIGARASNASEQAWQNRYDRLLAHAKPGPTG
jgi:ABC-type Fe3+ transport system substrate-binding protein